MDRGALATIAELLASIAADVRAIREHLATGGAPDVRDPLLAAVTDWYGDGEWTVDELLADASDEPALDAAIAGRTSGKLGAALRTLGSTGQVVAVSRNRRGVTVWRVRDIRPSTSCMPFVDSCESGRTDQHEGDDKC